MADPQRDRSTVSALRSRGWWQEIAGWATALCLGILLIAHVMRVDPALLFTDGDSVLPVLMYRSLVAGEPQDWALSPVLFVPESAVFTLLSLFGMPSQTTLALNALVNLLVVYGAFRLIAGRRSPGRRPVLAAVAAFAALVALGLLEEGRVAGGFSLVSMLLTTTYYSATVVGALLLVGLVRRVWERPRSAVPLLTSALAVSAVSTLTNPLFLLWAAVPVVVVAIVLALLRRVTPRDAVSVAAAVVLGAAAGYLGRSFFSGTIVAQPGNYLRWFDIGPAAAETASLLSETAASPAGVVRIAIVLSLAALTVVLAVRALRADMRADVSTQVFVLLVAVLAPVLTTAAMLVVGSSTDRYLQPWVFLPPLALLVAVELLPPIIPGRRVQTVAGVVGVAGLTVAAGVMTVTTANDVAQDDDLRCVVEWVDVSGRTGAGPYWAVRAPKAYAADPSRLLQVDDRLQFYAWLVNRSDRARADEVTFLIEGPRQAPFLLPPALRSVEPQRVACGVYTIVDYGVPVPVVGSRS